MLTIIPVNEPLLGQRAMEWATESADQHMPNPSSVSGTGCAVTGWIAILPTR